MWASQITKVKLPKTNIKNASHHLYLLLIIKSTLRIGNLWHNQFKSLLRINFLRFTNVQQTLSILINNC